MGFIFRVPAATITPSGYFAGGASSTSSLTGVVEKFVFSTESLSVLATSLTTYQSGVTGVNSSLNGYYGGGSTITPTSTNMIRKMLFSTDSLSTLTATLVTTRNSVAGVNSTVRGYFGGGQTGDYTTPVAEIDGIQFSDDTAINPAAVLVTSITGASGVNSSTRGYFLSGAFSTEIDGIQFDTEAAINPTASTGSRAYAASFNSTLRGYIMAGFGSFDNTIQGFVFSTESVATVTATLVSARRNAGGGNSNLTAASAEIDGLQFDVESAINPAASLTVARWGNSGCQSGGYL